MIEHFTRSNHCRRPLSAWDTCTRWAPARPTVKPISNLSGPRRCSRPIVSTCPILSWTWTRTKRLLLDITARCPRRLLDAKPSGRLRYNTHLLRSISLLNPISSLSWSSVICNNRSPSTRLSSNRLTYLPNSARTIHRHTSSCDHFGTFNDKGRDRSAETVFETPRPPDAVSDDDIFALATRWTE